MATVVVLGANAVSRAMSRDLLAAGIGRLVVVADEALGADGVGWPEDPRLDRAAHAGEALRDAALLCAVSDTGEAEALYEANRLALATGRPYLPCWIDGMIAHAGPLTYGFETACLRCYRLRADANDDDRETARAVRRGLSEMPAATRTAAGVVPPMTSSAGALLAMEVLKALSGFAPSDAVGRHIELNLVAFGSHVRRVLKVPRCPDCCDSMRRKPTAMLAGPQIPVPPARPHVHEAP
jgi:bacteriocin biosynthesis cyclodehydratase domain-containing protein